MLLFLLLDHLFLFLRDLVSILKFFICAIELLQSILQNECSDQLLLVLRTHQPGFDLLFVQKVRFEGHETIELILFWYERGAHEP